MKPFKNRAGPAILRYNSNHEINVNVIFEPPWNSQKIIDKGREF
jgi:metal-sulfur cluster biosynthetic enzyme